MDSTYQVPLLCPQFIIKRLSFWVQRFLINLLTKKIIYQIPFRSNFLTLSFGPNHPIVFRQPLRQVHSSLAVARMYLLYRYENVSIFKTHHLQHNLKINVPILERILGLFCSIPRQLIRTCLFITFLRCKHPPAGFLSRKQCTSQLQDSIKLTGWFIVASYSSLCFCFAKSHFRVMVLSKF